MTVDWERRVVPKWPASKSSLRAFTRQGSTSTDLTHPAQAADVVSQEFAQFHEGPSIGRAADLMRFADAAELREKLIPIARYLDGTSTDLPSGIASAVNAVLGKQPTSGSNSSENANLHQLRRQLSAYPRDAMGWLDLARALTSRGKNAQAERAIRTALSLAGENRFAIRAAVRFYLHNHEADRARWILDHSSRTSNDPWLIASHIAVNSILDRPSRLTGPAKRIIKADSLPPRETAELAGSLATLALANGDAKAARDLFNKSLRAPNDNALAQAEWASRRLSMEPDLPEIWFQDPSAAEANYYRALFGGDFKTALDSAKTWADDEPFAARPMISSSFICAVLDKLEDAEASARLGLLREPTNVTLLNNLAFAQIRRGDFEEGMHLMRRVITLEGRNVSGHTLANLGLLAYESGEPEQGERLYRSAIAQFEGNLARDEIAVAAVFHAFAAKQAKAPNAERLQQEAERLAAEKRSVIGESLFNLKFRGHAGASKRLDGARRPRKWKYDPAKNLLIIEDRKPFSK